MGARVTVLSRLADPLAGELRADLADQESLKTALGGLGFDYVIHAAGVIDQGVRPGIYKEQLNSHLHATLNLVEAIDRSELKRFVQIGSNAEYGAAPCPNVPDGPTSPNSAYGVSKLAATRLILAKFLSERLPATVVRPFLIYGPDQGPGFFFHALKAAREGLPFPTSPGLQTRDFVPVSWVVEDIMQAALDEGALGRVVNSCSGCERSIRSVLELTATIIPSFKPIFGAVPVRPTELMRSVGTPYQNRSQGTADSVLAAFIRDNAR
jgi:nucleoside-diphosphate-sugar epimerase